MNVREIATVRLREYENNPRNNDLAVEKVKYSIERFGFLFPIVVDMNFVIVCGHTRVRACRELGIQTVPCIIADELTEDQINLFRLIDNKTSEYSDWDFEKLKNELSLVDLTLDKNQSLLEQFELTAEVFDLDPEMAEIRVPTLNFIGTDEKPVEKKPTVSTIQTGEIIAKENDESPIVAESQSDKINPTEQAPEVTPLVENIADDDSIEVSDDTDNQADSNLNESKSEASSEPKKSNPLLPLYQFRFGEVAFFISKVELDRLNDKYADYVDADLMTKISFAEYLLREVEHHD